MSLPSIGETAPDFTATTASGETVKLSDFRGQLIVLYFYPKADTPGCTKQACAYRDSYDGFEKRGVVVLGVSPDTVEDQQAFQKKYDLPFTLLADADHSIAETYDLWGDLTFEHKGREVTVKGVERSTLIIDENGTVIYSARGVDPTKDTAMVLEQLDAHATS